MAFVWARWAPHYAGTDGQESGRQIPRARCTWMCFHVSRKCLTPGPLLTSNLGCQRHFLECPVKINMWTEKGGLETPAWWARGPSWHLCPAAPLASYVNIRLDKIKCLFSKKKLVCGYCKVVDLVVWKVILNIHHHYIWFVFTPLMIWASLSLCTKKKAATWCIFQGGKTLPPIKGKRVSPWPWSHITPQSLSPVSHYLSQCRKASVQYHHKIDLW